ncbi:hypothetical protein P3X46_009012 [Hevea brasiliensis]|uniref:Uncharacterized protein n=1 Tax=Hevea brasiliensis TaxID=3981 RepID=A0ABQ9MPB3_HEVBR|nr:hypothetical protein P3X46_009012 [Hevea brasiliensis]
MPYPPYSLLYKPCLMYPPQQHSQSSSTTIGTQNPMEGVTRKQVTPPPLAAPTVPTQETKIGSQGKVKMMDYLNLDDPKCKLEDDSFEYVKAIKMIANKLDASDSMAIQMADFTLKCKKVKEWYKSYVVDRVDSMN